MDSKRVVVLKNTFDGIAHTVKDDGVEYWLARELMSYLGYTRWENFIEAINRAKSACIAQKVDISSHFRDVAKMVEIGIGKHREITDVMLSRAVSMMKVLRALGQREIRHFLADTAHLK